jgi:Major Facilitator Superfamily
MPLSEGFRGCLETAVDDLDRVVDYAHFKQRLKYFGRRRAQLRHMLQQQPDGMLSEQTLFDLVGPKEKFPSKRIGRQSTIDDSYKEMSSQFAVAATGSTVGDDSSVEHSVASFGARYYAYIKRQPQSGVWRRVSVSERNELLAFLEEELSAALVYYWGKWQALSQRLDTSQAQQLVAIDLSENSGGNQSLATTNASILQSLGDEILDLMCFCAVNVLTTQQILIRYDAFVRAYEGTPLSNYYLKKAKKKPTAFRKLLHHDELQAVAKTFLETCEDTQSFASQVAMFKEILNQSDEHDSVHWKDEMMYKVNRWFLQGLFEDRLGLEPAYLLSRGQSLIPQMHQIVQWRKQRTAQTTPKEVEKQLSSMHVFMLTLNLLSAFLYCMNYYVVEPSSPFYVNRLGAQDAMAGALIGMMPLGAFVSSIPYSYWTNYSFRQPFLVSCCCMLIGNLLYAIADSYHSIWFAMGGRFLAGLGAPKCIVRRYMADTTPLSLRTSVNAGFGMVVAAGSALGPATAVVLNNFYYRVNIGGGVILEMDGLTLPGYFMALLWLTFGIIVLATFDEPYREGLKEQQELEARSVVPNSQSSVSSAGTVSSAFSDDSVAVHNDDDKPWIDRLKKFANLITLPVRLCLLLLFCKVFTIESLVSATSTVTKNRYQWDVKKVGTLGLANGLSVIPFSILIGRMSMIYQDHLLMKWLVGIGMVGTILLIDFSDMVSADTPTFNEGHILAVTPQRYVVGYFMTYLSIQTFEGVIGSTLSKVIPTQLASGTFNSGLLATLVDTFGRTCGDNFITIAGLLSIRQIMNLLFVPAFLILTFSMILISRCKDMLSL